MNTETTLDSKKKLIRNGKKATPNSISLSPADPREMIMVPKLDLHVKNTTAQVGEQSPDPFTLSVPTLNSTIGIRKKIKHIRKKSPLKDFKENVCPKRDLAINEKITRRLNFRHDENVYNYGNLIPLEERNSIRRGNSFDARIPVEQKDVEPQLFRMVTKKVFKDYKYAVSKEQKDEKPAKDFDGYKTRTLMQSWK